MRGLVVAFFLMGWFGAHGDLFLQASFVHSDEFWGEIEAKDRPPFERATLAAATETACLAALLGWALGRRRKRSWVGVATLSALVAGPLNGALLGCVILGDPGIIPLGLEMGLVYALIYLPPIWFLGHAALGRRSAAPGSLVGEAEARKLWRDTLLVILLSALIGRAAQVAPSLAATLSSPRAAAVVAFPIAVWLLIQDLRARRRLALLSRGYVPYSADQHGPVCNLVELGVGDEIHARVEPPADPYRQSSQVVSAVRGDAALAERALDRALNYDRLLLLSAVVIAVVYWR